MNVCELSKRVIAFLFVLYIVQNNDMFAQYSVVMKTAKPTNSSFSVILNPGDFKIDWGDGLVENVRSNGQEAVSGTLKGNTITVTGDRVTFLDCSSMELTDVDVSDALFLKTLYCSDNDLVSLSIQSNGFLENLDCSGNKIKYLSLSFQRFLRCLDCSRNELKSLSLSSLSNLEVLICHANKLDRLDLSGCHNLETLWCQNNNLVSLNLEKNKKIGSLNCDGNGINLLILNPMCSITDFWCNGNSLKSLSVPASLYIETFSCSNNQLSSMDLSGLSSGHKALFVDMSNNCLDFSSFYSLENVVDYVYAPQAPLELSDQCVSVGEDVSIKKMEKNVDGETLGVRYEWYNNTDGSLLEYGKDGDYTYRANYYRFFRPFEDISCHASTSLYPDLVLESTSLTVEGSTGVSSHFSEDFICTRCNGGLYIWSKKSRIVRVYSTDSVLIWEGEVTDLGKILPLTNGLYIVNGVKVLL